MKKVYFLVFVLIIVFFTSCDNKYSSKRPEFHSAIVMDDDLNVVDWGHCGEYTPDHKYTYYGTVTLFTTEGYSETFDCYTGKDGNDKGYRGVLLGDNFYNIDKNKWVTINGIKYIGDAIK